MEGPSDERDGLSWSGSSSRQAPETQNHWKGIAGTMGGISDVRKQGRNEHIPDALKE